MKVEIQTRDNYELYIKSEINKQFPTADTEKVKVIHEMLLEVFDSGIRFAQGRLNVEVSG